MKKPLALVGLLIALLMVPIFHISPYFLHILILIGTGILITAGFRLIFVTGRLTLGHAAIVGIGAYASSLLSTRVGMNFWLSMLLGGLIAALIAILLGFIVLRISGVYFAMVTFALAEVFKYFLVWWKPVTGGSTGIIGIPAPVISLPGLLVFDFGVNKVPYYYLIIVMLFVLLFLMYKMERSRVGKALHAIGENDLWASHLGINIAAYRVFAFATACFVAGLVGSFMAHYMHYTSPEDYSVMESLYFQINALVGGITSFAGPIVGTFAMVAVSEGLRFCGFGQYRPLPYGVFLVLILMFLPGGLVSLWRRKPSEGNDEEPF
jgi:branched-chain amino acid transport system permease protein